MGLDELKPFNPKEKVIDYLIEEDAGKKLVDMNLQAFADETSSESVAPGGGSVSAYVGALGVSLGTMVANLSSHKRGWDERWEEFSRWAEKGQAIKDELIFLVDEDTRSFNSIMDAFGLPKGTEQEKIARHQAIQSATKYAIEVPYRVMVTAYKALEVIEAMVKTGNPTSVTDAGVGALCARTAVIGAYLNVKVNTNDLDDKVFVAEILQKANEIQLAARKKEDEIIALVDERLKK